MFIVNADIRQFQNYLNSFYGVDGIYSSDRDVTFEETLDAIEQIGKDFQGDSIDREKARDIIFTTKEIKTMYKKKG